MSQALVAIRNSARQPEVVPAIQAPHSAQRGEHGEHGDSPQGPSAMWLEPSREVDVAASLRATWRLRR